MNIDLIPGNDYILLTPGPLSTSKRVRFALLKDWCTWDSEYNNMVQDLRSKLLNLANASDENYTTVLMQGSGSFSVESVVGSVVGKEDKLLILINGEYGKRISKIAEILNLDYKILSYNEKDQVSSEDLKKELDSDEGITHVAFVHCETTTGILNPLNDLCKVVKEKGKVLIVDAMSSFGGIPIEVEKLGIDYLISSSNKCIQGVPGFGLIIANKKSLSKTKGYARSLALDLYDQHSTMEKGNGKWRFTSPTHVVYAFYEALKELEIEGGVEARYERYKSMQKFLVEKMGEIGYHPYLNKEVHSPIITTFRYPSKDFSFIDFYNYLKTKGFVIYPGKLSDEDTFRIGNIGDINMEDIKRLTEEISIYKF